MAANVEMSQDIANYLLREGATLIILDMPIGTEIGIDLKSWNTAEKFKGIKMIPPGIHIIYYNGTNKFGDMSPRISFMHNFKKCEFLVKRWNPVDEELSDQDVSEDDARRLQENLKEMDRFLGCYPYDIYKEWKKITTNISDSVLKRVTPDCGVIRSALEMIPCEGKEIIKACNRSSTSNEDREDALLPKMKAVPGTYFNFTEIPKHKFPENSSPVEITKHSLDNTYVLNTMIESLNSPLEIIGELEVAFISFLVGNSLECLEHWTHVVSSVCICKEALINRRELYAVFLPSLEAQLNHVPQDFLVDIVASENVIYRSLRELFRNMKCCHEIEGRLRCEAIRFQNRLTEKFNWDFDNLEIEDDDEAPVIVDLDEVKY